MTLALLPNLLWMGADHTHFLSPCVDEVVQKLDGLIAESAGGGRRFLDRFRKDARNVPIALMREKVDFLLEPLLEGESWGVVSDAGLPCVADPGSQLVTAAYRKKIQVAAYPGPCSITHALMLSGLYSQCFTFHGYIAKDPKRREMELQLWEEQKGVHIFIEAPHRNQHSFDACRKLLDPQTTLSVASNLTAPNQFVETKRVRLWEERKMAKEPTIFLFKPQ
ncbi:MAG: Ribosomal RNA small subunit methyltransferase I [Chlamydiales bacterium]|nr:Ribosomal RNA small subunit methyltransferase I [Chlamydiales bacterium]MCH9636004.1 Ribosomal RNA small subunit methyltransferase I [Chlamydiales bacterium]MCH9703923.1 SAM-dependent methyltransferase [Chlamydiota bacterium]